MTIDLNYPDHKHPHGVENSPPNACRIWVCEECLHIFTDGEIREDMAKDWGHACKSHPCRKGQRCESHLEPYTPDERLIAWWDHPVTNAYTEAIAGLVKLTNHAGRGYSFKAIRAKLLYSNLPTFHRPVFDRSLKERPPFMPLEEIIDYGVKFSTLRIMLEGG